MWNRTHPLTQMANFLEMVGVFNFISENPEHVDLLFYQLFELSINFPAIYVNINVKTNIYKTICKQIQLEKSL